MTEEGELGRRERFRFPDSIILGRGLYVEKAA